MHLLPPHTKILISLPIIILKGSKTSVLIILFLLLEFSNTLKKGVFYEENRHLKSIGLFNLNQKGLSKFALYSGI